RRVIATPPPIDHTLIVVGDGHRVARSMLESLRDWVDRGGHLVIALPNDASWLDALKHANDDTIDRDDAEDREDRERALFAKTFGFSIGARPANAGSTIALDVGGFELAVDFDEARVVSTTSSPVDTFGVEPSTAQAISYERGRGRVTVLGSVEPLTNDHVGEHDHAEFALRLARLLPDTRGVSIAFDLDGNVGFLKRLWTAAWPMLAPLVVLALLWAWRAGKRFGPRIPEPVDDLRDFADHVRAAGEYLLRSHAYVAMVAAARGALDRSITRTRPDLARQDVTARERELAQAAELPADDVREAMTASPSASSFVRMVRTLERIRRSL
ncbi:MAG: hypothetical protein IT459_02755, partial [Planctomycetes bacterium]|nr:hypothetical protein [Planctomycetota bacterium]